MSATQPVPDLSGKVILITGGTAGLGKETILALARRKPEKIFFTGRNEAAASALIDNVKRDVSFDRLSFLKADISSLASVDELSKEFLASEPGWLDVLMCNAGIMATPPALSKDGYEIQFATNHLGHALLIRQMLPLLQATAEAHGDARIICLSSVAHDMHPKSGIHFSSLKTTQEDLGTKAGASWARYGQSKLANMLYPDELTKRCPNITSVAVHPGVVETELVTKHLSFGKKLGLRMSNLGTKKIYPAEGAKNQIWAATASGVQSGVYYVPVGVEGKREKLGNSKELARELWECTERELDAFDNRN
ncbi:MAG: hypothetical protein Q9218_004088 [Villophora microphyllina]